MKKTVIALFICLLLLSLTQQVKALSESVDSSAIAEKIDINYTKFIEYSLIGIGSSELGFRVAGTPQDLESARFVADQMMKIGLEEVALEPVPVDAWEFKGASLTIHKDKRDITFPAASMGGVLGTRKRGITAEIVYVGTGEVWEFDAARDVEGKLVLANWDGVNLWVNMIAHEATLRGALGVILTNLDGSVYAQGPGALLSFDATYDLSFVPLITISKEAGYQILDMLKAGPVTATMKSDITITLNANGWNTIGVIPGTRHPEQVLIFAAHHDAWFTGAVDDTSGVAAILTLAKAIRDSGYRPEHTMVFTTHTGEEYGYTNAYYEWIIGAWWQITHEHPEWQSTAIAYLNFEGMGMPGPLDTNVAQELKGFFINELGKSRKLLPYGWIVNEVYSWNELWTFTAAGVPGITFSSGPASYTTYYYHTQLDTVDLIDWNFFRDTMKFYANVAIDLDTSGIQPYNFETRAQHLIDNLDTVTMTQLGVDSGPIVNEAYELLMNGKALEMARQKVTALVEDSVQSLIREAARVIGSSFTALSAWDYTIYPHQQVEMDALHLGYAIDYLEAGDMYAAMRELEWWVAQTWYVPITSYEVYTFDLTRHAPDHPKLTWGAQGHLAPYINLWNEYVSLARKAAAHQTDFAWEIASLRTHYESSVALYQQRINAMTQNLQVANALLAEAIALLQ